VPGGRDGDEATQDNTIQDNKGRKKLEKMGLHQVSGTSLVLFNNMRRN